jgi:hypothetical protein
MHATMRISAPHWGHRSGSTSKIWCNSSAHRRRASRSGSGTGSGTDAAIFAGGASAVTVRRAPRTRSA